tara:strand:+ start:2449 stop:2952 length:504 start_codon:yes stop_codon:yes gene_type:complete
MIDVNLKATNHNEYALMFKAIAADLTDKEIISKVLRPVGNVFVKSIKDTTPVLDRPFKVYRNQKLYTTIEPGTLKNSIGIIQTASSKLFPGLYIGPRYKYGKWKKPNIGGWFMHMVQFGTEFIKPNPFVLRGFLAARATGIAMLEKKLKSVLKKIVSSKGKSKIKLQ